MVPYFGTHGSRQRINNNPIRVGYKIGVLPKECGYMIQFDLISRGKIRKADSLNKKMFSTRKCSISAPLWAIKLWKQSQGIMWIKRNKPIEVYVVLLSLGGTTAKLCTLLTTLFHHNRSN